MINGWFRVSSGLGVTLKASHGRQCCRESVIKKETHIQCWVMSCQPRYLSPSGTRCSLKSILLFEFKAGAWYSFLRLIPNAGQEEGCPNAACDASRGMAWVASYATARTYFTTARSSPPLQVFHGRFVTGAPFPGSSALGFAEIRTSVSLKLRSSGQNLAPLS